MTPADLDLESVVDLAYEAAIVPERWPLALDAVASITGTAGGLLFSVDTGDRPQSGPSLRSGVLCVASHSVNDLFASTLVGGWGGCIRGQRTLASDYTGFVTDFDICTPSEIEGHPFYSYARRKGFGWATGLSVKAPSGDTLLFNWERRYEQGPVERKTVALLDSIKGHLSRAALMASRIGLAKARSSVETLRALDLPAAALSHRARVITVNTLFADLVPDVFVERAGGYVSLVDPAANKLLADAVSTALLSAGRGALGAESIFSIPLAAEARRRAMVVHVVPLRRNASDVFDAASVALVVTAVRAGRKPKAAIIQGLFDLTPAEARVAQGIAGGSAIEDIARASGTSEATVRSQLRAVFTKTGVTRQAALVNLLSAAQGLGDARDA